MTMEKNIYCKSEEEFEKMLNELREKGYLFEDDAIHDTYWWGKLSEDVLQRVGKCGFCNSYINIRGVKAHGRKCENCGETISLNVKEGDRVRFFFRDSMEMFSDIELIVHSYDMDTKTIRFYAEIPEQKVSLGAKTIEQVQEKLDMFSNDSVKEVIEGKNVLAFFYPMNGSLTEETKINFAEVRGGKNDYCGGFQNADVVLLYEGKEYGEFGFNLPIPDSVTVYKDWKIIKDAKTIVSRNGMSSSPSYYSGRGATMSDLDSKILQGIHDMIVEQRGKEAGKHFVNMVSDIEELSATDFLTLLYKLERNKWVWDSNLLPKKPNGVSFDSEIGAFATIFSALGRNGRDDTSQIRNTFLSQNGKRPKPRMSKNGDYLYY
jgi:hypothetical protein